MQRSMHRIIREHKSLVPFTLIRGDNYLYIMFYIPGYTASTVIELTPLETITQANSGALRLDENQRLFQIYRSYFEAMWNEKAKPISSSHQK